MVDTLTQIKHSDFLGRWDLSRKIEDRKAGQTGLFEGTAEISAEPSGAYLYLEQGHIRLGDSPPLAAQRRYIWRLNRDGFDIRFEDERPFHTMVLSEGQASHLCGEDTYVVHYAFECWPQWSAQWDVLGPRKDYSMTGVYKRG